MEGWAAIEVSKEELRKNDKEALLLGFNAHSPL